MENLHKSDITEKIDNSRLAQAKRKLERLETELNDQIQKVFDHQKLTNGQPVNDKRSGRSWFNRKDQLESKASNLMKEIEVQKERISDLEYQKERNLLGINAQGGLLMTVENIPHIKKEIENYELGNSMYTGATIRKYKKKLIELQTLKKEAEKSLAGISPSAQKLIESDRLTPWKKNPTIYFVKGLRKVALVLTESGHFVPSSKYEATTEKEKTIVAELLKGSC